MTKYTVMAVCGLMSAVASVKAISAEEILVGRPQPVREIETRKTLKAADFGMMPNSGKNMLPAFRRAVDAAISCRSPVTLQLDPGVYHLDADEVRTHCIELLDAQNIVLDGQGAELIINNPRMGMFLVEKSHRIIIKNFSVDYDPLPYAQGWVTSVDESGAFDIRLTENSPDMSEPYFEAALRKWGGLYDADNPILVKGTDSWVEFKSWDKIGKREYRINAFRGKAEVGDAYVQVARENACKIVMLRNTTDSTIENITTYACPSSPYTGNSCSNIGVFNCNVLIRPGRWLGANGDAVHFQRNAVGPWVEGCQLDGICDDAVNIYSVRSLIAAQPDARSITVVNRDPASVTEATVGTTAWIFDPVKGALIAEAIVKKVKLDSSGNTVVLDRKIPELELDLPGRFDTPHIYFSNILCNQAVFRNNTVRYARRFGIVVPTQGVVVEDNLFDQCAGSGIKVSNHTRGRPDIDMFTGGRLVLRNNTIRNCEQSNQYETMNQFGAINLSVMRNNHTPAEWRALNHVLVENNTIENWQTCGIRIVSGGKNVVVRGNRLISTAETPLAEGPEHSGILVENSDPVSLENNTVSDPRPVEKILIR